MKKRHAHKFAIIGTGMVGTAIGFLLKKSGYKITSLYDKSPAALKRAVSYTEANITLVPQDILRDADYILITTPDDAIASACADIALSPEIKNKFIFHMSGAGGLDLLEPAKKAGAYVASIHPLQSFSSIEQAIRNIPGSYFGITAEKKALLRAKKIVRNLQGIPIVISPDQKPLYHAAACFASNYLVTLMNIVESISKTIGINEKDARQAYLPLVYGSLKNIEKSGSILSLTGPIARGDCSTVRKHIQSFQKTLPQYASVYSELGFLAVKIAQQKGTLSAGQTKKINALLKGVKS
ncbi:MAG TPA: DUF2520 domain-containing protein [Smithella sp.]|nr:DUF2520 domain-containing protein [Syntrophaceae bacterium]MDM7987132.1 DUF2520 domain-containing protein [Smithella sp.]HNY50539.1 DUF2520 domain-containing protein [Smithella sp.]HOG90261.1 DUF2520 domain-containing protein [Smithella sp.]HOU51058.1 DUF2520 domain-containing protein [Smithella sp.]